MCWSRVVCSRIVPDPCFSPLPANLYSEACGGPNLVSLYASVPVVALPVPSAMKTNLPGSWSYAGCLREPTNGTRMFPYMNQWITNNSALACMNQCATYGYTAAGVEVSQKAYLINMSYFGADSFFIFYSVWYTMLYVSTVLSPGP